MALLAEMFIALRMEAPDVPHPLAVRELRLAWDRFCVESEAWRYTLGPFPVDITSPEVTLPGLIHGAGADITFDIPAISQVNTIATIYYDGRPIAPTSIALMDAEQPNWRSENSAHPWFVENVTGCTLVPTPAGAKSFIATVSLRPVFDTLELDDALYFKHRQTIINGALASLLIMPDRVWTNVQMASYYAALFAGGVAEAKIAAEQDHQPKKRVTRYGGIR